MARLPNAEHPPKHRQVLRRLLERVLQLGQLVERGGERLLLIGGDRQILDIDSRQPVLDIRQLLLGVLDGVLQVVEIGLGHDTFVAGEQPALKAAQDRRDGVHELDTQTARLIADIGKNAHRHELGGGAGEYASEREDPVWIVQARA